MPAPIFGIPTLSEWGMIAVAAGFILIGVFYAVRKRRASA
ncbi:MAG TPA: IPTL-CTERM sorting domain-containing protein [Thermodesulfobacteriota bacterium]|nr:IPTL-CTERM sorting domain-containing protein [Thermodesulfobacteriota bacterium]